ncbi:hypothetical protein [Francisella adeliensis]|uniref:Uncharacterized protein n=1 Tax=Francisella adeliensis TaxID=2007306 RepID=A0ABX6KDT7_9GAMM|nr:hypothetical protein [Francisella adeliensis]MBK2085494.1 hypothetical protein [Francisella adeliensis]MBK2097223.1 hypothetical protein [Francisella adeliensis]QIW11701.1 hypothetical protein FZC43_03150 [Francisella adeliensis]QIW13575.1 hypothetical protein FZC44_03150 [Francisella adeliensis]
MKKIILMTLAISVMLLSSCSNDAKKKAEQQKACDAAFTQCNETCKPDALQKESDVVIPPICTCPTPDEIGLPAGSTVQLQGVCSVTAQCEMTFPDGSSAGIAGLEDFTPGKTIPGGITPGETTENTQCLQSCTDVLNQCSPS